MSGSERSAEDGRSSWRRGEEKGVKERNETCERKGPRRGQNDAFAREEERSREGLRTNQESCWKARRWSEY